MKPFADMVGKTIVEARQQRLRDRDDTGYLRLVFHDATQCTIMASYGGFTGQSESEYPTRIGIAGAATRAKLVDLEDEP